METAYGIIKASDILVTAFLISLNLTNKVKKKPLVSTSGFLWNPAATYSPGPLPAKYHRH